jgi:hypothetical protein
MTKCDKCEKEATIHMTEVEHKTKQIKEIHLCDEHAIERLEACQSPGADSRRRSMRRSAAGLFVCRHFSRLERWSALLGAMAPGYMISFGIRAEFGGVDAIGWVIALGTLIFMASFRVYLDWLSGRTAG